MLVTVIVGVPHFPSSAVGRYEQIAASPGIPYRDFQVEYAPGELGIAELVGHASPAVGRAMLAVLAFAGDLVTFAVLRRAWGSGVARRYLWLGLPLLVFIYRRADLVVVAATVSSFALALRRRWWPSGILLACAVLTRVWPAALAPWYAIERRTRTLWIFAGAACAGVLAWVALTGIDGIRQVYSFRGATGWELESSVGAVVWALTGERRFESGANRTGQIPAWAGPVMLALLILVLAAVWLRAARRPVDPAGPAALAALAGLLLLSPLLSPQYVSWLLPWAAIAGTTGRRWSVVGAVPIWITGLLMAGWYLDLGLGAGADQAVLVVRNLSLAAIVACFFVWTRGAELTRRRVAEGSTEQVRAALGLEGAE